MRLAQVNFLDLLACLLACLLVARGTWKIVLEIDSASFPELSGPSRTSRLTNLCCNGFLQQMKLDARAPIHAELSLAHAPDLSHTAIRQFYAAKQLIRLPL